MLIAFSSFLLLSARKPARSASPPASHSGPAPARRSAQRRCRGPRRAGRPPAVPSCARRSPSSPGRSRRWRCGTPGSCSSPRRAGRSCRCRPGCSGHGSRSRFLLFRPGVSLVVLVLRGRVVALVLLALPRLHGVLTVALLHVAVLGHGLTDDGVLGEAADAVVRGVPAPLLQRLDEGADQLLAGDLALFALLDRLGDRFEDLRSSGPAHVLSIPRVLTGIRPGIQGESPRSYGLDAGHPVEARVDLACRLRIVHVVQLDQEGVVLARHVRAGLSVDRARAVLLLARVVLGVLGESHRDQEGSHQTNRPYRTEEVHSLTFSRGLCSGFLASRTVTRKAAIRRTARTGPKRSTA